MTGPVFEFSEVFKEDYLYFYGPQLEFASLGCLFDSTPTGLGNEGQSSPARRAAAEPPAAATVDHRGASHG